MIRRPGPGVEFPHTVEVEVDVRLQDDELNDMGYYYRPECEVLTPDASEALARAVWDEHERAHSGALPMCDEGACAGLRFEDARLVSEFVNGGR